MVYYLLVFISFLESVFGFTLISSSVMLFKEPVRKRIAAGLALMIVEISLLLVLIYTLGGAAVERFSVLFIVTIEASWYLVCSRDRFFVSVFSFLSFVNIYIAIGFISDTMTSSLSGNTYIGARILIRLIIYLLILPLLYTYVRPRFRNLVETLDKEWGKAVLIPLLFLVLQTMIAYYAEAYWKWSDNDWLRYIIFALYLLFLAVYYLMYNQAKAIAEKYALEKRQLLLVQQEKLWESELLRQKAVSALASRQRHDLHHHVAVVMGLLQSGESSKLMAYLKSFDSAIEAENSKSYCENPIANSIINHYVDKAEQEHISVKIEALIPEKIGIEHVDLTCVLGNVLENALEGCLRLPAEQEKEIDFKVRYLDRRLRVRVENTCDPDIQFDREFPKTKKTGGGTGTRSIVYTADRYDGTAGFSVNSSRFIAQIVLNEK